MEEVYIVDGECAKDVRRQLQDAAQDMEEKRKDEVDSMPPSVQQGRANGGATGWWRSRVNAAPIAADMSGFALVVNGSSLVSLR